MKIIRQAMDWGRQKATGTAGSASGSSGIGGTPIDMTGVADGDVIIFDTASGTWIVGPQSGGPPSGAAGGDLGGTYPNPTVNQIGGIPVDVTSPTDGYVIAYDSGLAELVLVPQTGGASGYREVLMASGITNPPDPLVNADGTDWLYGVAA